MKIIDIQREKNFNYNDDNCESNSLHLEIKTIAERFLLKKRIGGGSFGEIYLADDSIKNMLVAVKTERMETVAPQLPSKYRFLDYKSIQFLLV